MYQDDIPYDTNFLRFIKIGLIEFMCKKTLLFKKVRFFVFIH